MKLQKRNCTEFEYYAYTGKTSDLNDDGLHTGIPQPIYKAPVTYKGNISAPSGSALQTFAGLDIRYTHTLVMDDPNVDIKEYGYIVWKGKTLDINAVRPSLNVFSAALQERTVNYGEPYEEPEEPEEEQEEQGGEG